MNGFVEWIKANKEWLFSGVGVAILSCILFNKSTYRFIKKVFLYAINKVRWQIQKRKKKDKDYDDSLFISETPPDGISRKVGEEFVKSWTVRNNGNKVWKNRTLKCVECVDGVCYPERKTIKIPTTYPGQERTFTVKYILNCQGDYQSRWKMFDEHNQIIYPQKNIGLRVHISVR